MKILTSEWFSIGNISKYPENEAILVEDTPFGILVVVYQNSVHNILSGICTHEDYELGGAPIQDGQLTCMLHMSSFDLKSGKALDPPADLPLKVFISKVEKDIVYVKKQE